MKRENLIFEELPTLYVDEKIYIRTLTGDKLDVGRLTEKSVGRRKQSMIVDAGSNEIA